ncbi:MAG: IPT/TIG domain-containing protein, partial [Aestuariivirga sp.]
MWQIANAISSGDESRPHLRIFTARGWCRSFTRFCFIAGFAFAALIFAMLQSSANADPGPLRGDINCGADQYFNTELQQCFAGQRPGPVADAGAEQTVENGQSVTLHGDASNTLGETVSYIWDVLPDTDSAPYVNSLWKQLINSPDSQSPTITAPTLEKGAPDLVLTFSLTVRVSGYGSDDDFLESAPTTVHVTVRAPHEAAAPPPPVLSLVEPGHGAVSGGTSIAITGENLNGTTGVTIGGMPAGFTIVDDTTLNVVTPKGPSAGLTSIVVTTAGGSETIAFTYDLLPQDGENALVVSTPSGSMIYGVTMAVSVSGGKGSGALSLAGTQGVCDVGDLTDNHATITATGLGTCTITATKAADATYAAGYATARIEITAPQLLATANPNATSVAFKVGNQITPLTPISASGGFGTLSFTVSPALPAGLAINAVTGVITGTPSAVAPAANFIVTVTDQSPTPQTSSKSFNLQVVAPLRVTTITSVSPASGETIGGTALTISGANFTGATAVSIGGVAAASFKVNSDTSISAKVPGHVAGAVDVVVTVPTGPVTATQAFTYVLAPQTITFGSLPDTGINETPPALSATVSSTLVVSYVSKTTGVCTIGSGTAGKSIINFVAAGDCSITANQAGNGFYESADPVTRTFKIILPPRENINTKPVVNAGEDKTIYSDETIQFLATASDGDNDPLTYQ